MSISVSGVGATPSLKTIPVFRKESDFLEFAFGLHPIIKLIAWEAAMLKIDFICATADFFVTWCVVCRNISCVRLDGARVNLQTLFSLGFHGRTQLPSLRT
jgi:hypothetical protein